MFAGIFSNPASRAWEAEVQNVSQNTAQYLVLDTLKCPPEAPLAIQEWLQKDMPPTRMTWWDVAPSAQVTRNSL